MRLLTSKKNERARIKIYLRLFVLIMHHGKTSLLYFTFTSLIHAKIENGMV